MGDADFAQTVKPIQELEKINSTLNGVDEDLSYLDDALSDIEDTLNNMEDTVSDVNNLVNRLIEFSGFEDEKLAYVTSQISFRYLLALGFVFFPVVVLTVWFLSGILTLQMTVTLLEVQEKTSQVPSIFRIRDRFKTNETTATSQQLVNLDSGSLSEEVDSNTTSSENVQNEKKDFYGLKEWILDLLPDMDIEIEQDEDIREAAEYSKEETEKMKLLDNVGESYMNNNDFSENNVTSLTQDSNQNKDLVCRIKN